MNTTFSDHPSVDLALIWAMDRNRVIGRANGLPWRLPADLAHFKSLTTGHPVIMGRKTFESLGRPLPNRTNIVVTRDPGFQAHGCQVVHSVQQSIEIGRRLGTGQPVRLFVIGGSDIYRQMLPFASTLYPTVIDAEVAGDAWFPELDWSEWQETERRDNAADDRNPYRHTFLTLKRRTNPA